MARRRIDPELALKLYAEIGNWRDVTMELFELTGQRFACDAVQRAARSHAKRVAMDRAMEEAADVIDAQAATRRAAAA